MLLCKCLILRLLCQTADQRFVDLCEFSDLTNACSFNFEQSFTQAVTGFDFV